MLKFLILNFIQAALNFQSEDIPMQLNQALFDDNGKTGFVLKPMILRDPLLEFDPTDINTMNNKKTIKIKIISAQDLPMEESYLTNKKSDPYVVIEIYGVPGDVTQQKTHTIIQNGFNPSWNQEFEFLINCPELAFVRFSVTDENLDSEIGYFVIKFECMMTGLRNNGI